MRRHPFSALIVVCVILLGKTVFGDRRPTTAALLSFSFGRAHYEDITKGTMFPPAPIELTGEALMHRGELNVVLSRLAAKLAYDGAGERTVAPRGVEKTIGGGESNITLTGGVQILPSQWRVDITPEAGWCFLKEQVAMGDIDSELPRVYREVYEDQGLSLGATCSWGITNGNFVALSYRHDYLKQIYNDSYSLTWRYYFDMSVDQDSLPCFLEVKVGSGKKSDSRDFRYITVGFAFDCLRICMATVPFLRDPPALKPPDVQEMRLR
jgi:hypothetical protein